MIAAQHRLWQSHSNVNFVLSVRWPNAEFKLRRSSLSVLLFFLLAWAAGRLLTRTSKSEIIPKSISIKTESDERLYWRSLNRFSWVSNALLLITLFATAYAAFQSAKSASEASRQADAADESNRPWVKVEDLIPKNVSVRDASQDDAITVKFDLAVKNSGHSPALNLSYITTMGFDVYDPRQYHDYCKGPANRRLILFPDEQKKFNAVSFSTVTELRKWIKSRLGILYNLPIYDVHIFIVGCVLYDDTKGRLHTSGFGYDIGKTNFRIDGQLRLEGDVTKLVDRFTAD